MAFLPKISLDTVTKRDGSGTLLLTYAADDAGRICFRYTDSTSLTPWQGPIPGARATTRDELIAYIRSSRGTVHTTILGVDHQQRAEPLLTKKKTGDAQRR